MAYLNYYANPTFPLLDIPDNLAAGSYDATNEIVLSPRWQSGMSHIDRAIEVAQQPMDWVFGDDVGGSGSQSTLRPSSAGHQPSLTHHQQEGRSSGNILNQLLASYHHSYPAPLYTVDRRRNTQSTSRKQSSWWKANNYDVWEVLMIAIDIIQLRTFAEGLYHPQTVTELWHPAGEHWLTWRPDKPLPRKSISRG
jgi:hypothetical protein